MSTNTPPAPITTSNIAPRRRFPVNTLRDVVIILVPVILFLVLAFSADNFLTFANLTNVLNRAVAVGLIAGAGTLVILAGGFDLSAGAILGVASLAGAMTTNVAGPAIGILVGLAAGSFLGFLNGVLVSWGRVDHIVGTLGTMIAFGGIAVAMGGSGSFLISDPSFAAFATTRWLGITLASWYLVAFLIICSVILNFLILGRRIFATGGNVAAARLSGVSVNGTLMATYTISGFAAGLAGLVLAASSLSTRATSGATLIWDAIAAILIGGNSIRGGRGAIWRTIVGLATLILISNGFNLLGIDPVFQQIVTGGIILVAVLLDVWTRRQTR